MITFEEAYAIDRRVYNCSLVTHEEKAQVREVMDHIRANPDEWEPGHLVWCAFAIKDYPKEEPSAILNASV